MLSAIVEHTGIAFASVSLVLAVGQFCFGITQPLSGIIADAKSNRFALLLGIVCTCAGLISLPFCKNYMSLMAVLGILLPGGIGMVSFGLLMGTIFYGIPRQSQSTVSGIVNASSGIGNTILTPVISSAIVAGGLMRSSLILAILTAIAIPFVWSISPRHKKIVQGEVKEKASLTIKELMKMALCSKDYLFIAAGFFTCGFHMALITNHLATQIISYGYSYQESSSAFSIYGVATMIGALLTGIICAKFRMKNVLGFLYGMRVIATFIFLLLPKNMFVICGYVILLGATGASTVTPVSGLCERIFGERGITIFFGIAFVAHQIGGFLSAWLGGICFEMAGSYVLIWCVDIVLCAFASIVSFLIRE